MARKNSNESRVKAASTRYDSPEQIAELITPTTQLATMEQTRQLDQNGKKKKPKGEPPNKLALGLTDLGATTFAQGLNEGWGYLMRMAGKWSKDGFLAEQNDVLQGGVPAIGGLLWYLIEMYGLGSAPSHFKMGRMEAAKLVHNLGLQKFWAALRYRGSQAKEELDKERRRVADAVANNKDLEAQIAYLKSQLPGGGK